MNTFDLGCPHEPKSFKKIGNVLGKLCEISVCQNCKNHPDLQHLQEEVLQK